MSKNSAIMIISDRDNCGCNWRTACSARLTVPSVTVTPLQVWHVILHTTDLYVQPSFVYVHRVMLKWHILEEEMLGVAGWLEHPFWVVQKQRGQLHTKRPFADDRDGVYNVLAKFQDHISNIRRDIVSSVSTFVTGLRIDISSIRRSFFPHLHQVLLVNICWNIPKRLISAFQTLIRYYVHKTGFVIILAFCPKLYILSAFQSHLECQTDHNHANKCLFANLAAFNVQKWLLDW